MNDRPTFEPDKGGAPAAGSTSTPQAARRLESLRAFLARIHRAQKLAFGFRLWDGSIVPADHPAGGLALRLGDEGVVASLLRSPRVTTVMKLYMSGRIAIENGTALDFERVRPRGGLAAMWRQVPKLAAVKLAGAFLFAPRGGPSESVASGRGVERRQGKSFGSDQADIAYHYDVSDTFYRLFLDERMVYSCGYFTEWHGDIDRAQRDKLDMICRKLRLSPGERFLDIGCGWGALVCYAAEHYGVRALGVTLSPNQFAEAERRVADKGLNDRVRIELRSYAGLEGEFDKIASVGMFEHVGLANHAAYFRTVRNLLVPRGVYLHHAISRWPRASDRAFSRAWAKRRSTVDFIFPGGELDHLGMTITGLQRAGFEVHDIEGLREHYQHTTRLWHDRLHARRAEAEREAGPETTRLWLLYLAACSIFFERGAVGIFQTLATRKFGGQSRLPPTRAHLYRDTKA